MHFDRLYLLLRRSRSDPNSQGTGFLITTNQVQLEQIINSRSYFCYLHTIQKLLQKQLTNFAQETLNNDLKLWQCFRESNCRINIEKSLFLQRPSVIHIEPWIAVTPVTEKNDCSLKIILEVVKEVNSPFSIWNPTWKHSASKNNLCPQIPPLISMTWFNLPEAMHSSENLSANKTSPLSTTIRTGWKAQNHKTASFSQIELWMPIWVVSSNNFQSYNNDIHLLFQPSLLLNVGTHPLQLAA